MEVKTEIHDEELEMVSEERLMGKKNFLSIFFPSPLTGSDCTPCWPLRAPRVE